MKYVLNPAVNAAFIPGKGRVRPGQVLEGDYTKYCPSILIELPEDHFYVEPEPVVEVKMEVPPAPPVEKPVEVKEEDGDNKGKKGKRKV